MNTGCFIAKVKYRKSHSPIIYCTGTLKVGYKRKIVSITWAQLFLECQYLISDNSKNKEKSWIEYYVCDETRKKILLAISMLYQVMERCTTFEAVDDSL